MAQSVQSITFNNCYIDTDDWTITEVRKDDSVVHALDAVLENWNGIHGLTLSIQRGVECCVSNEGVIPLE